MLWRAQPLARLWGKRSIPNRRKRTGSPSTRAKPYWLAEHARETWAAPGTRYEDYRAAYAFGYNSRSRYSGSFDDAEVDLSAEWNQVKGESPLAWQDVKQASRSAWNRVTR